MSAPDAQAAFARLHPGLQRWIWQQGWRSLRDIQVEAIGPVLARQTDIVISAPTASGKTEAALLPILSDIAAFEGPGLRCLYIAPLRALINDQTRRIETMCGSVDLTFQPWHGDITAGRTRFWKAPANVLLITPESLEAMLMRRGSAMAALLAELRYALVDELHAFMGTERGRQLQSLLHRVERLVGRQVPRIALSATLGDLTLAQAFLRSDSSRPSTAIAPPAAPSDIKLQVKAIRVGLPPDQLPLPDDAHAPTFALDGEAEVANDLFKYLRGESHLVFANARARVEALADALRARCEAVGVPNEFFPHHGSLSRELRSLVESRLRDGKPPTTAICTSTLEMGIDIGAVATIAQVGPPPGVASLKQRVGRSGRRPGTVQTLRQYVMVAAVDAKSPPLDRLRIPLVQSIATIELMLEHAFEPPVDTDLHLSTLMQQLMSAIYQRGGQSAAALYALLCESGPFGSVSRTVFIEFLHALGESKIIEQGSDGTLLPGAVGEKIAEHYDFYAAFQSSEEWRLITGGHTLGAVPTSTPMIPGSLLVFAGRRWKILEVDGLTKSVVLVPAAGGAPPRFEGVGAPVDALIRHRMRDLLARGDMPPFLNVTAEQELAAARAEYRHYELDRSLFLNDGADTWLALFEGDRVMATAVAAFRRWNIDVLAMGPFLLFPGMSQEKTETALIDLARDPPGDAMDLAGYLADAVEGKHDRFLSAALRRRSSAARDLNCGGLAAALARLLA